MEEIDLIIQSLEELSEKESIFRVVKELEKYVQENNVNEEDSKRLFDASDDILLERIEIELEKPQEEKTTISDSQMRNYIGYMKNIYKFFVLREKGDETKAEKKYSIFKQYYENNETFLDSINFDFLDDKFLEIFSQEQYSTIARYPYIQKLFLEMNDKEIKVFENCFENYNSIYGQEGNWTLLTEKLVETIAKEEYDKLIEDIDLDKGIDLDKLTQLLSSKNYFNIESVQQFEEYDEIKMEICNAIMSNDREKIEKYPLIIEMSDMERRQFAVLQKLYGLDLIRAQDVVRKFGEDIDSITISDEEDLTVVEYVKSIKAILDISNEEILDEFYNISVQIEERNIHPIVMEQKLKKTFIKEYNKDLFKIEGAEEIIDDDINKQGVRLYNAGTDFSMIIHSVGACISEYDREKDYRKDWNRDKIVAQGFSTSYIRNDMLGTASIHNICYGFSEMDENSLMLSGSCDICSGTCSLNPSVSSKDEAYYTPNTQIDKTEEYNEMVFRREQNGERKQPDYIVVFKHRDEIANLEESVKASKDFGGLPIVVVDIEECARSEKDKIEKMIEEYEENGVPERLLEIKQKVRNNCVLGKCARIIRKRDGKIDTFLKQIEEKDSHDVIPEVEHKKQIGEDEYAKSYERVGEEEKLQSVRKIVQISKEIQNIMNKGAEAR